MKKAAAVVMTAVLSFFVVARGETLCLCDDDPDDCGHACHDCGRSVPEGVSEADDCLHFDVAAVDLVPADGLVRVPSVVAAAPALPAHGVLSFSEERVEPCATSPPPGPSFYCRCSVRLFPRS